MTFSTTSFIAGVGTMFAAVTLGFAGGAMITTSPKIEPNRLERVSAQIAAPAGAPKPEAAAEAAPAPDRIVPIRQVAMQPTTSPQSAVAQQPQSAIATEDSASSAQSANSSVSSARQSRQVELKQEAEARKVEHKAMQRRSSERRKRQEIEAAANAVRQAQRDGSIQEASQRDDTPQSGFFGND